MRFIIKLIGGVALKRAAVPEPPFIFSNQTIDCYFRCYEKQVTMATKRYFYISAV